MWSLRIPAPDLAKPMPQRIAGPIFYVGLAPITCAERSTCGADHQVWFRPAATLAALRYHRIRSAWAEDDLTSAGCDSQSARMNKSRWQDGGGRRDASNEVLGDRRARPREHTESGAPASLSEGCREWHGMRERSPGLICHAVIARERKSPDSGTFATAFFYLSTATGFPPEPGKGLRAGSSYALALVRVLALKHDLPPWGKVHLIGEAARLPVR